MLIEISTNAPILPHAQEVEVTTTDNNMFLNKNGKSLRLAVFLYPFPNITTTTKTTSANQTIGAVFFIHNFAAILLIGMSPNLRIKQIQLFFHFR